MTVFIALGYRSLRQTARIIFYGSPTKTILIFFIIINGQEDHIKKLHM